MSHFKVNLYGYTYCFIAGLFTDQTLISNLMIWIGILPLIIDKKCFLVVLAKSIKIKKNLFFRVYSKLSLTIIGIEFGLFLYSLFLIIEKVWDISTN